MVSPLSCSGTQYLETHQDIMVATIPVHTYWNDSKHQDLLFKEGRGGGMRWYIVCYTLRIYPSGGKN